jgi:ferredoxin
VGDGWAVTVDRERCIGSGSCVLYAPATFSQDDTAIALVDEASDDPIDTVTIAVEACPTRALRLTVTQGG